MALERLTDITFKPNTRTPLVLRGSAKCWTRTRPALVEIATTASVPGRRLPPPLDEVTAAT
jgi:hypothetical protein